MSIGMRSNMFKSRMTRNKKLNAMTVAEAVNVFEKKPEVKVLRKFGKKKKV